MAFLHVGCRPCDRRGQSRAVRSLCCRASLSTGDVVEYRVDNKRCRVGVVVRLVQPPDAAEVFPLRRRHDTEDELFVDQDAEAVDLRNTEYRVLQTWPSQRQVSDRRVNPHGEMSEDCWTVEEPLSDDIQL